MKKRHGLRSKWFYIAMLFASSALTESRDPYVLGHLNFFIDAQLVVKGLSSCDMPFHKDKSEILGTPITSALSLSEAGKRMFERKCTEARESGTTMAAVYYLNLFSDHPHNPYMPVSQNTECFYEAEITPLFAGSGVVGFSVKVRRYSYYMPLEIEEW